MSCYYLFKMKVCVVELVVDYGKVFGEVGVGVFLGYGDVILYLDVFFCDEFYCVVD